VGIPDSVGEGLGCTVVGDIVGAFDGFVVGDSVGADARRTVRDDEWLLKWLRRRVYGCLPLDGSRVGLEVGNEDGLDVGPDEEKSVSTHMAKLCLAKSINYLRADGWRVGILVGDAEIVGKAEGM